ncbi:hypothetical protein [Candidatus Entotheonella palauensis]|uniref:hypothetical protein n=1 Tax=Candidatus Entotheonella palauensis TaxID=93172 RepID=UPI000B7F9D0A|nr:hypothetical protein [Candidatus Entotheonella palauensis]
MQTLSNVDQALGFLRGEDNPFDTFVAGQEADDDFFNFHVPELHQPVMETLCLAMERYRRPDLPHPARPAPIASSDYTRGARRWENALAARFATPGRRS